MNEHAAREEICRVGKSLFDRGYVHATAGNISVRLDEGFLITPTDACLGFLDPAALAGEPVGRKLASVPAVVPAAEQARNLVLATRRIFAKHETVAARHS